MAYYLNYSFVDANKFITASIPASTTNVSLPLRIEWEVEFEARKNGTEFIVASTAFNTTSTLFFIRSGTDFELRSPSNSNWLVTTGVTLTNFNLFKIRSTFNGTTAIQTLHINGSLIATRNPTTAAIGEMASFFGLNSNSNRHGDFKYFKFTDFVTPANNRLYDANASGGTGTILPETIGGFNGNQSGTWPGDNSEWVFYSSGTAYSDTLIGATFTSSGNTLSATASYGSTLNGSTYSSSGNALAVTRGYSSVLNSATFTSSGGNLSATRGYSSLLNGGSYSYSGNELSSAIANGSVNYSDTLAGASFNTSGGALQALKAIASALNGGSYSHSGNNLTSSKVFYSAMNGGVYSYSGNNMLSVIPSVVTVTVEDYTITFANDYQSIACAADNVTAIYAQDYVSATWSN